MKHHPDCVKAEVRYKETLAEYEHQWPHYCTSCGGWGGYSVAGCSVPYGSTYVNLPDETEVCPDCLEEGICPRCGERTMVDQDSDAEHCTSCGWNWDEGGAPFPVECYCWDHPKNNPTQ